MGALGGVRFIDGVDEGKTVFVGVNLAKTVAAASVMMFFGTIAAKVSDVDAVGLSSFGFVRLIAGKVQAVVVTKMMISKISEILLVCIFLVDIKILTFSWTSV